MGFAGFLSILIGIILAVTAANGRLQNVIAAFLGQTPPGPTPTGSSSSSSGGGIGSILNSIFGGNGINIGGNSTNGSSPILSGNPGDNGGGSAIG